MCEPKTRLEKSRMPFDIARIQRKTEELRFGCRTIGIAVVATAEINRRRESGSGDTAPAIDGLEI